MPSKGSKAASRQAQLRQKRRRGRGAEQDFDAGPSAADVAAREDAAAEADSKDTPSPRAVATRPSSAPSRSRRAPVDDTIPEYKYLGGELKRVGVVAVVILAILALLSFLLGG